MDWMNDADDTGYTTSDMEELIQEEASRATLYARRRRNDALMGDPGEPYIPLAMRLMGLKDLDLGNNARANQQKCKARSRKPGAGWPKDKSTTLKSVTSNKYHAAVFPNMRVPIGIGKDPNKEGLEYGDTEEIPIVSGQCPIPGGSSVVTETNPVEKVSWGPVTRIRASKDAKDMVEDLGKAHRAVSKADKVKRKNGKNFEKEGSDEDSKEGQPTNKDKSTLGTAEEAKGETFLESAHNSEVNSTLERLVTKNKRYINASTLVDNPVSPTDEGATTPTQRDFPAVPKIDPMTDTNDIGIPTTTVAPGIIIPPFENTMTPIDEESASADPGYHADNESTNPSSMATNTRRTFLRAPPPTPPETIFLNKTSAAAAMSMPTIPTMHHLANIELVGMYQVEFVKNLEAFKQQTLDIKRGLIDAKVARGGISKLLNEEYTVELASREAAQNVVTWFQATGKPQSGLRSRINSLKQQSNQGDLKALHCGSKQSSVILGPDIGSSSGGVTFPKMKTPWKVLANAKDELAMAKEALENLDLAEHVEKITTRGSIRHQSTVKREMTDGGEKRTVTTWIEVTEVYDVPAADTLSVFDIVTAMEQELEGASGNEGSSATTTSNSSGSSSDKEEAAPCVNEAGVSGVLRSISRLEGEVPCAERIAQLSHDLGALLAGLEGEGALEVSQM